MPGTYDYDAGLVFSDATNQPVTSSTTGDFYDGVGGTIQPIYDLNGSPIAHLNTNEFGYLSRFKADVPTGAVKFGTLWQTVVSRQGQNGAAAAAQATAAASSAAAASSSASSSATAASTSAAAATAAASGTVTPARLGAAPDGTKVLYGDGTWRVPSTGGGGGGLSDLSGQSLAWEWVYSFTSSSWPALPASPPAGYVRLNSTGPSTPPIPGGWTGLPFTFLLRTS